MKLFHNSRNVINDFKCVNQKVLCFLQFVLCMSIVWGGDLYDRCFYQQKDTVLHENSKYIAVIGDIQNYTRYPSLLPYYSQTLSWISSHSNSIEFVLQVGDITNDNYLDQWERFYNTTLPFVTKVPFYACIGNHDYVCLQHPEIWEFRDSTKFCQYVTFPSTVSHIVAQYESMHYENIVIGEQLFEGDSIFVLILEMEPRPSVLNWAIRYVKEHPNQSIILLNHRYLNKQGHRYDKSLFKASNCVTAEYLWQNLVYPYDNIRCVLCGHIGALSRLLFSRNVSGREVPQVEFNIQRMPHGGDGLIQLWEFPQNCDSVYVRTFSTQTQQFYKDTITEFNFKYR